MAKAPLSKAELMFDDLVHETDMIRASDDRMAELSSLQRKALESILEPSALEIGKPVAVILFWQVTHCLRCGEDYAHPQYPQTGALLKRWFARRRFFKYESLIEHRNAGYDNLKHRIETVHRDVTCCPKCFDSAPRGLYICPECGAATPQPHGLCAICATLG